MEHFTVFKRHFNFRILKGKPEPKVHNLLITKLIYTLDKYNISYLTISAFYVGTFCNKFEAADIRRDLKSKDGCHWKIRNLRRKCRKHMIYAAIFTFILFFCYLFQFYLSYCIFINVGD